MIRVIRVIIVLNCNPSCHGYVNWSVTFLSGILSDLSVYQDFNLTWNCWFHFLDFSLNPDLKGTGGVKFDVKYDIL